MGTLNGLIQRAYAEEGYVEKASATGLDSKLANKGTNNYTKYSRDVNNAGLMGCQGQAWCCTHQFWLEMQEFGVDKALEHFCMTRKTYRGYNCFDTYNAFKAKGRVGMTPKLGAVVIFTFSHAGRVVAIDYTKYMFACEEGNTSSNLADRNGGQVKIKWRSFYDSTIKGFCYIDYAEEQPVPQTLGWVQTDDDHWRFYQKAGNVITYVRNDWHKDATGRWSYFDDNGYALCNQWLDYRNHWYFFNSSCYMKASEWLDWKDDWFYLTADGSMATDAYVASKQPSDNKYYYVNEFGEYDSAYDKTELDYTKDKLVI
jgi:hypothetical protein